MGCADVTKKVVLAALLFGFSAWLGFVLNIKHRPAAGAAEGAAPGGASSFGPPPESFGEASRARRAEPHHGPRAPPSRAVKKEKEEDDLDVAAAAQHHIKPHTTGGPDAITADDWSANGRFQKPDPVPYHGAAIGDYPPLRNLWEIVDAWNPDNVSIPYPFKESLMVFNYSDERERGMAESYRNAELPFKVYGVPDVERVRAKWTDGYLVENFDHTHGSQFKVERSKDNHFMYWRSPSASGKKAYPTWTPPTQIVDHTFAEWLSLAHGADEGALSHGEEHKYLMMGTPPLSSLIFRGQVKRSHFVSRDLPCFTPLKRNFFITDVGANKGIQCRFGMRGVIAEAHYDGGRNMIAMVRGAKRYILSPPTSCKSLNLIPERKHPSFRHSITDWSDPDQARNAFDRPDARSVDTVVREGEVLYVPSYWIHYIVSLQYSAQCNSRSGAPPNGEGQDLVSDCMGHDVFPNPRKVKKVKEKKGKKEKHDKLRGASGFPMQEAVLKDH